MVIDLTYGLEKLSMTSKDRLNSSSNKSFNQSHINDSEQTEDEQISLTTQAQQAKHEPNMLTPRAILQLQRTIGNQAVISLLGDKQAISTRKSNSKIHVENATKTSDLAQRSDLDFLDDISDEPRSEKEGGPLPIEKKKGDGPAFGSDATITKVQWRGGRGKAHSEVFCVIPLPDDKKGILRFSRNQGADTFQRNAEESKSSWEVYKEASVNMTVSQAENLAEAVHNSMTRYISGDCHQFAETLYNTLQTGQLKQASDEEDGFM